MADRIDVDEDLSPVRIPAEVLHELRKHARESVPDECCGLILQEGPERYGRVFPCLNVMTSLHEEDAIAFPRTSESAYYMNPVDLLEVHRSGDTVTAVYHSHVGAGAYLSRIDLDYANDALYPYPDADQIVLSVVGETVGVAGLFRRSEGSYVGHPLEAEGPS